METKCFKCIELSVKVIHLDDNLLIYNIFSFLLLSSKTVTEEHGTSPISQRGHTSHESVRSQYSVTGALGSELHFTLDLFFTLNPEQVH